MTDTPDPLAAIEALLDWPVGRSTNGAARLIPGDDLRAALAEARQAVDALVAERDAAREALADAEDQEIALVNATPDPLTGRCPTLRPFVFTDDLRAAIAQPATDEHECDTGHFDRTFCPEPCGMMHSYCATCGKRADACAHDPATDEEAGQ